MNHTEKRSIHLEEEAAKMKAEAEKKALVEKSSEGKKVATASGEIDTEADFEEDITRQSDVKNFESEDSVDAKEENQADEWLVFVEENTGKDIPEPTKEAVKAKSASKKMELKKFAELLISTMGYTGVIDADIMKFLYEKIDSK